jgi:NAD(P)H-nitrite reductase large subunit
MGKELVLIGNGMVRVATREALREPAACIIRDLGAEPCGNDRRILRPPVVAGEKRSPGALSPTRRGIPPTASPSLEVRQSWRSNRADRRGLDDDGNRAAYDRLRLGSWLFATQDRSGARSTAGVDRYELTPRKVLA